MLRSIFRSQYSMPGNFRKRARSCSWVTHCTRPAARTGSWQTQAMGPPSGSTNTPEPRATLLQLCQQVHFAIMLQRFNQKWIGALVSQLQLTTTQAQGLVVVCTIRGTRRVCISALPLRQLPIGANAWCAVGQCAASPSHCSRANMEERTSIWMAEISSVHVHANALRKNPYTLNQSKVCQEVAISVYCLQHRHFQHFPSMTSQLPAQVYCEHSPSHTLAHSGRSSTLLSYYACPAYLVHHHEEPLAPLPACYGGPLLAMQAPTCTQTVTHEARRV